MEEFYDREEFLEEGGERRRWKSFFCFFLDFFLSSTLTHVEGDT